jgi:hypothetical protein
VRTEEQFAALAYWILDDSIKNPFSYKQLDGTMKINQLSLLKYLIEPVCTYVGEKLDEQESIVGRLVRYKKRCEWFGREELQRIAAGAKEEGKIGHVELSLQRHLYRYLHDMGTEFFMAPSSYKGEIDLIAYQGSDDPAYVEVKVFDGKNLTNVKTGFGQLWRYLQQYNASVGYLAVFCDSERIVEVQGDGSVLSIPFIRYGNRTTYVLVIDIHMHEKSVSKSKDPAIIIRRADLVPDETASPGP